MKKKLIGISVLCILMALALSGCWREVHEIYHFPDGAGRMVFRSEITKDILTWNEDDDVSSMEDVRDELHEYLSQKDDYSADHPNISAVTKENYIDPVTDSLYYVTEVDVINMLEPFFEYDDMDERFVFTANPDGTYRFSFKIEALDLDDGVISDDESTETDEVMQAIVDTSDYTIILHVYDFIEGDPQAVYDPAKKTVTWVWPMSELFPFDTDQELWAVYRIEPAVVVEPDPVEVEDPHPPAVDDLVVLPPPAGGQPQPDGDLLVLPTWVPFVVGGLCCLSLVAVVVVIVVVVVLKKR